MDITCGVLLSHNTSDTKLHMQLSSLLYNDLCKLKNVWTVYGIQLLYDKGQSRIKMVSDALRDRQDYIKAHMSVIEKYTDTTKYDIDIISVILNAQNAGIPNDVVLRGLIKILERLSDSSDMIVVIDIAAASKGQNDNEEEEDEYGLSSLFDAYSKPSDGSSDCEEAAELLYELLKYNKGEYVYYDVFSAHKDEYKFNIHVEKTNAAIHALINSFSLLSQNRIDEFKEYSIACNSIDRLINELRFNLRRSIADSIMEFPISAKHDHIIYAPRNESEIFMEAILRLDNFRPGEVTTTKTPDEINTYRNRITELDNQGNRYGVIDYLLTVLTGCTEISNTNREISRLDMIFMIDKYPAGSELENYAIFDAISVFQRRASELLGITPNLSIYHANGNYKASIMRNVCFSKCETEYMIIRDDDDIGCSLTDLCGMIKAKQPNYPDSAVFYMPSASIMTEKIGGLQGMWTFIFRPKILKLFSINNPPYLMAGEDYRTIEYIYNLQLIIADKNLGYDANRYFKPIVDNVVPDDVDDTTLIYLYMITSNRANDLSRQYAETQIYTLTMNTILGIPIESTDISFKWDHITKDKKQFIKELKEYAPLLFDRVYSFKKLTLQDIHNGEPFYSFATNRPYKEELNAAKERFNDPWFDKMIPRKCRLNESTGEVTISDDNPMKELEKYRDKNTFTQSEWDEALSDYLKKNAKYIESLTDGMDVFDGSFRVKLFGGKQTTGIFKWLLLAVLIMIVLLFVCYAICRICKRVTPPHYHLSQRASSDSQSFLHGYTSI